MAGCRFLQSGSPHRRREMARPPAGAPDREAEALSMIPKPRVLITQAMPGLPANGRTAST